MVEEADRWLIETREQIVFCSRAFYGVDTGVKLLIVSL